jgi:gliding motility-associated-like protein
MIRNLLVILFLFLGARMAVAQSAPIINSFSPESTYPLDTLIITGSGFSSDKTQLAVMFGTVAGNIISSTTNIIQVIVLAQATLTNIEVINLSNKLEARSNKKFVPYYSGDTFDPSRLGTPLTISNVAELYDYCSCDFNSDGKPDVAASKFDAAGDLLILKNTSAVGTISFTQQTAAVGFPTEQVSCGDLNGDGKPDLVASRSGGVAAGPRHTIFFLKNTSIGTTISFSAATSLFLDPTHYARYILIRDLNIDGKPEIIVSNSNNNEMYIYLNTTTGADPTFDPNPLRIAVTGATNLYGLDVQDMNGDSRPEIIVTQFNKNNIYILINESTNLIQFNSAPFQQTTLAPFNKIVAADFNEDGKTDIVATNFFGSSVDVWFNSPLPGVISFTKVSIPTSATPPTDPNGAFPNGLDVGDIDGDKDLDILVGCQNQLDVMLNNGNNASPGFTRVVVPKPNINRNVLLVDFDGDGKPDISHVNRNGAGAYNINFIRNANCFKPEILNTQPLTICTGQKILLRSVPGINVTNDWQKANVSFNGTTHVASITTSGSYTVASTGEGGGCIIETAALIVANDTDTAPQNPVINGSQPICTGQTLALTTAAVGGATYTWKKPNGSTVSTQNLTLPNITVSDAGEYSLVVSVSGCNSNEITALVDVTNLSNFDIYSPSLTNSTCQGSTITLTATDYPDFNYQWFKNGASEGGQTLPDYVASASGIYKCRITHATIPGCTIDTRTLDVKVLSQPVANFVLPDPSCVSTSLNFTNASDMDDLGTRVCSWDFGDGSQSSLCDDTHTYATAQSFPVTLTVSYLGVDGCSDDLQQSLVINSPVQPVITPSLANICPNEETTLTVSGGTFSNFDWSNGGTGNPLIVSTSGTYEVITTDANGCIDSVEQVINANPAPTVIVTANPEIVSSGQQVQLEAVGADSYIWSPAESLDNPNIANPIATPLATTTYTVTASKAGECTVEVSKTITVEGGSKIPNVFTPNQDGDNETWYIPGGRTDCQVSIYDKGGSRILDQTADTVDWDGTYNGKPVPPGTYYYVMTCPNTRPVTGNILVAR